MSAMRVKFKFAADQKRGGGRTKPADSARTEIILSSKRSGAAGTGDYENRETWLSNAVSDLSAAIKAGSGLSVPNVRVSCGFPYGKRGSKKFLGQCWAASSATDNKPQIFISPLIDDTETVLAVLAHELCHAAVGAEKGHDPDFNRAARGVGFHKPFRQIHYGSGLKSTLTHVADKLGPYPHAKLSVEEAEKEGVVSHQGTRLIKLVCPKSGYTVRTTKKWLDAHGPVISPVTKQPMKVVTQATS
jgi:hypothetical protein